MVNLNDEWPCYLAFVYKSTVKVWDKLLKIRDVNSYLISRFFFSRCLIKEK